VDNALAMKWEWARREVPVPPLLSRIDSPADLRPLSRQELAQLAREVRQYVIQVVSRTGGHLGASLGVVELTLALHHLYEAPVDRIVWDVGHQSYVHKVLTGRREALFTIRQAGGISGFCNIFESPYDVFGAGHASTSISAALGLATARDLAGEKYRVVCVTGDGAMTGGLAYEGLNNAGSSGRDLMVILNDNSMSISPNVGAISHYLTNLSTNPFLNRVRHEVLHLIERLPRGEQAGELVKRLEKAVKSVLVPAALFQALGFQYFGPVDGHDLDELIDVMARLKPLRGPVLLHVLTRKGEGHPEAESTPDRVHAVSPAAHAPRPAAERSAPAVAAEARAADAPAAPPYTQVFARTLIRLAEREPRLMAITAAMADGTGLAEFQRVYPQRFFDVGIAEAHALTFAAGLARAGARPVAAIYSTFLQRAYDQIIHDVALQRLPVVLCLDRAGLVGADGPTHHGVFDLSYLRLVPEMCVAAPRDGDELADLIVTALAHESGPFAIRYPKDTSRVFHPDRVPQPLRPGSWVELERGEGVAVLGTGAPVAALERAAARLREEGLHVGLVNCRFVKPLDLELLASLARRHAVLVTVEENTLCGGFGSAVHEGLLQLGVKPPRLVQVGVPDRFIAHAGREQQLAEAGLAPAQLVERLRALAREVG
jgi:1-deoxy-D-xylulose-5-phosphate synthase